MWVVALYLAAACCSISAQPISCFDDHECGDGNYCEESAHKCFKCLHCADVKKQTPSNLVQPVCVKSFLECGPCFEGLVVDARGDINSECVSPDSQQQTLSPYLWVPLVVGVVIIAVVIALLIYRKETVKVWASTSVRSWFDRRCENQCGPDLPPPYNPEYYAPNINPAYAPVEGRIHTNDDPEQPFIKQAPAASPRGARESAGQQTARVYNQPAYHYEDDALSSPEPTEDRHKYPPGSPWMPIDEDTVPSTWTPDKNTYDDTNNAGGASVSEVSDALVAVGAAGAAREAREGRELEVGGAGPPAAKRARGCSRQDSDSNPEASAGSSASGSNTNQQPPTDNKTLLVMNCVINNVVNF